MKKQLELLAPAKNLESGIAAIKCGADAVYIGAERFGARAAVGNSLDDIEKLINFAHKYYARVYITINTLLKDSEIMQAQDLIYKLYNIGADAIIVQDMGLLELDLPPIPFFASTQANNTTPEKVKFLEEVGFQRVILARELSLEQIREIRAKTSVDLEFFVHGALCVCYSGQCYMSYAVGGRSANRGECAQPCRKKYSLINSKNEIISKDKYLLSLKDLNLSDYLDDLFSAGVSSFKIEGRLKDEAYIKNIVSFYRQKLDKRSSGTSFISFPPNPDKTFNRGYTDYFITGNRNKIASIDTPKSIGERIINISDLNQADGICYFDKNGELKGTLVNNIKEIPKNTAIFRNLDHEFLKKLNNFIIERNIKINLFLSEENHELILIAIDEDNVSAQIKFKNDFELAKDSDKSLRNIKKQSLKLGETDFYADSAEIDLKEVPFIPVSQINEIRRQLIARLDEERKKAYKREEFKIEKNSFPYPDKKLDYRGNVLNKYAESFYKRHGVEEILPAAETGVDLCGKKVMTTKYCIKYELGLCKNKEQLYLIDENNHKYELKFNCSKCEMEIIYS